MMTITRGGMIWTLEERVVRAWASARLRGAFERGFRARTMDYGERPSLNPYRYEAYRAAWDDGYRHAKNQEPKR